MNNMKDELFDLCKQVYEATGWEDESGFYLYTVEGEKAASAINALLEQAQFNCNAVPEGEINNVHIRFFNAGHKMGKAKAEREAVKILEALKAQSSHEIPLDSGNEPFVLVSAIEAAIAKYKRNGAMMNKTTNKTKGGEL